ncbi:hypothetical protein JOB18_033510 [Solea senegalensis]|uniref:Uncharacterized protein n=1 Tax=Solea senegalensis TaxID=28829 RepID=A0AAV6PWA0_SOLSE|nr:hypothetical protein JOB18_033510 [Solea senegalensis]
MNGSSIFTSFSSICRFQHLNFHTRRPLVEPRDARVHPWPPNTTGSGSVERARFHRTADAT